MKKALFLILFLSISCIAFSQEYKFPAFMVEANTGYAIGINLNSAMQVDLKLTYLFNRFGFIVEAGSILTPDKASVHIFLGPMMVFMINEKWRVPVAFGFDMFYGNTFYYGIGAIASAHYILTKTMYAGLNLGITYAFNNIYDEFIGYRTITNVYNEGTFTQTVPVYETKDHYGSYVYLKLSAVFGFQY